MSDPMGIQLANNVTELTVVAPLKHGKADQLRDILDKRMSAYKQGILKSPIEQIETIHYARWVIIAGDQLLLFTSNYDGDLGDYLEDFAERDEQALNGIFGFCDGWPGARPVGPMIEYVKKYQLSASFYYGAYAKYTVKEVKRALYWKQQAENFLRGGLNEAQYRQALAAPTPWPL
ncbi:MAG: hypothetical protein HY278_07145 [candidate division NC10 bacterium]|nr:hypothetical protein [candidate division NC10 bacterium]